MNLFKCSSVSVVKTFRFVYIKITHKRSIFWNIRDNNIFCDSNISGKRKVTQAANEKQNNFQTPHSKLLLSKHQSKIKLSLWMVGRNFTSCHANYVYLSHLLIWWSNIFKTHFSWEQQDSMYKSTCLSWSWKYHIYISRTISLSIGLFVLILMHSSICWFKYHRGTIFYTFVGILIMKIATIISRTTMPNISSVVLILMHFLCWFQIWTQYFTLLIFSKAFLKNGVDDCRRQ